MSANNGFRIAVLDYGFVYAGHCEQQGDWLVISRARCVQRWGTKKGLGEIAATVVDFHEFRRMRALAAPDTTFSPTGVGWPPCADAGTSDPSPNPEDRRGSADRFVARCATEHAVAGGVSSSLRVGDKIVDRDTRTIGVVTFIEYGPHGAPAQVRVMLKHGSAWRRADRIERLFR